MVNPSFLKEAIYLQRGIYTCECDVYDKECCKILLHVHPFLGNVLVNSPLLGYATIDEAVFSVSSATSNSMNGVLCDQLLGKLEE
jgi:hypothetical protein